MINYNSNFSIQKTIKNGVIFILVIIFIYQVLAFVNTPYYLAKINESYIAFWDTWNGSGYYEKYFELKSKFAHYTNEQNIKEIENVSNGIESASCIQASMCDEAKLVQIFDYSAPKKIYIKSEVELKIGSFVASGVNFVGEISNKKNDGIYEVDTIFNENKKYSVVNLKQSSFGYTNYSNSSIILNPLSLEDSFEEQDIIIMREFNSKILPQNLILGRVKFLGKLIYIENFLDFHFIKKLEVYR